MPKPSPIVFLKNEEIDTRLWDECIDASPHGLIYAKSFYLDNMCAGWCALAAENYDWVLPVTQRTKWGIRYLFQPAFTQQLGVFAKPNIAIPTEEILERLQNHVRFWEINWHYGTEPNLLTAGTEIKTATNFILNLSGQYTALVNNYHKDLVNNLKLSKRFHHIYRQTNNYSKMIELYRQHYADRFPTARQSDYKNFEQLCKYLAQSDQVVGREAVNEKGEVLACVLLLKDEHRLYNIMNTTTHAGRKTKANHFVLDSVIQEFSGTKLLFDFEGSDVPGVKSFYQNFGAINQPFFRVRYNDLAWPFRMLKR